MKRIWFGAALLALMLALGLLSSAIMEKTWQTQSENLNRAASLVAEGDWMGARQLQNEAQMEWERKQLLVAALCRHEPIDQIDGLFAQLEVFSEARRAVSFGSTCVYLSRQLDSLGQSHSFNLKNLF